MKNENIENYGRNIRKCIGQWKKRYIQWETSECYMKCMHRVYSHAKSYRKITPPSHILYLEGFNDFGSSS